MRFNRLAASAILALAVLLGASSSAVAPSGGLGPPDGGVAGATSPASPATTRPSAVSTTPGSPEPSPTALLAGPPRAKPTPLPSPTLPTGYAWPLRRATITQYFDYNPQGLIVLGGRRVHPGIDLATHCGDTVHTAHGGTVLYAGRQFDPYLGYATSIEPYFAQVERIHLSWMEFPIVIVIDDGNGFRSVYGHLRAVTVEAGQQVEAGDPIGWEGATGRATGCHLHYELFDTAAPFVPLPDFLVEKWHLPPYIRMRLDPLTVLPADAPGAGRRVRWIPAPADPPRYVAPHEKLPDHLPG